MNKARFTEWLTSLYQGNQDQTQSQKPQLLDENMLSKEHFIELLPEIMETDLVYDLNFRMYPAQYI